VVGTFVLTYGYAPASRNSRTIAASFDKGTIQWGEEYPMHEAKPATPTVSFMLTGIPARGPALSQVLASVSASYIITSVRQFVFLWASRAFLL